MIKPRGALRAWLLAAALSTSSTTALSVRANALFARDDTCGDTSYTQCPQAGFPDNFCCKPGTSCLSLAGNTTILCCPDGNDCGTIAPIVCNVQLQDAAANPQAVVKTTALTSDLPTCGSNCCPFGYTCDGDQNCVKAQDQSEKPAGAAGASSTASATPSSTSASTGNTSTASPTASATSSSGEGTTATAAPEGGSAAGGDGDPATGRAEGLNTSAIVGGVCGGLLAIIAIVVGVLLLRHRRRQAKKAAEEEEQEKAARKLRRSSSFVSRDALAISGPIPQNGFTYGRTDFVAKSHPSVYSTPSQAHEGSKGARSFGTRDSYRSYDSAAGRSDHRFEERSFHASAIVDGLQMEAVAADAAAKRERERMETDRRAYEAQFETLDIGLSPDLALGRNGQRDTTLTQWPSHPGPGGRR